MNDYEWLTSGTHDDPSLAVKFHRPALWCWYQDVSGIIGGPLTGFLEGFGGIIEVSLKYRIFFVPGGGFLHYFRKEPRKNLKPAGKKVHGCCAGKMDVKYIPWKTEKSWKNHVKPSQHAGFSMIFHDFP